MKEVLEAPKNFVITVEEPMVIFTYTDGRIVRYKADGKEEKHQYPSGTVKTKAKWEVDRLTIETNLGDGFKITHTYKTTGDPRQLIVTDDHARPVEGLAAHHARLRRNLAVVTYANHGDREITEATLRFLLGGSLRRSVRPLCPRCLSGWRT